MRAFISYLHHDDAFLDRLHVHLVPLRRDDVIEDWCDRDILAGGDLDPEILEKLETFEVFLALVSPDFLASNYCYEKELARAMERHDAGEMRVIPIILEPCGWKHSPLRRFKALPNAYRTIISTLGTSASDLPASRIFF